MLFSMQFAAALKLQCAYRCRLARKRVAEKRRPQTIAEILDARRKVFLADRAAARRPGYATSRGTGARQVEYERQRILAARSARRAEETRTQEDDAMRQAMMRERYRVLIRAHERLALGLQWERVDEKPSEGAKELRNPELSAQLSRGKTAFTRPEVLALGNYDELTWKSYIYDTWGNCFVPAGREDARNAARIAQDRTWAEAQVLPIRFRGLSRRQLSMVSKEQGKGNAAEPSQSKHAPTRDVDKTKDAIADVSDAVNPRTPSAGIERVRRVSKEAMDVARRASRASHDAIKKMLSA